jgi:hypothetical protein
MRTYPRSPAAIRTIGNAFFQLALEQVAKEEDLAKDQLLKLMLTDEVLKERVREYLSSAANFATSKL